MVDLEILKKPQLLSMFLLDELEAFGALAIEKEFNAPDVIFKQGAPADAMYIVADGSVEVLKITPQGQEQRLATLPVGALLGEMAFVDLSPRAATARAAGKVKLLEFTYSDIEAFCTSRPDIGIKFYRALLGVFRARMK